MTASRHDVPIFVGVDVGGTNIKVGLVDDNGETITRCSVSTEPRNGPDAGVAAIREAVESSLERVGLTIAETEGVGLATPGTMDIPAGMLLDPPNLPGWKDYPIRQRVEDALRKRTVLQNDANAAAYGEFWAGAARDADSLAFWTLGTGIGGGLIINDMIIQGAHSHGSECGHMIIEMDNGRLCATGQYGTLEAYASATALKQRCHEALDAGRDSSLLAVRDSGEPITPIIIGQEADSGDEFANELIMETAKFLGVGTTSIMHAINPDMVLFGGAMTFGRNETELGRRFMNRIREEVQLRAFPVPYERTVIDYATLGGNAGYIGAAGCARREFGAK